MADPVVKSNPQRDIKAPSEKHFGRAVFQARDSSLHRDFLMSMQLVSCQISAPMAVNLGSWSRHDGFSNALRQLSLYYLTFGLF
jgi:peptide subunit release factor RF-3